MARYTVESGQTLWDVAIKLYGSVEGIFDLLISNPSINMTTELHNGDILEYHEDFIVNQSIVEAIDTNSYFPANGEGVVYEKRVGDALRIVLDVPGDIADISFSCNGEGEMIVDWGDNTPLQIYTLNTSVRTFEHSYNNTGEKRRIKLYGDFAFAQLDLRGFKGVLLPVAPVVVDKVRISTNTGDLRGLFLFEGVVEANLQGSYIADLSPIQDYGIAGGVSGSYRGLQTLDLRNVLFESIDVLDDYLCYLADGKTHGGRRPCRMMLDMPPSERGLEAIRTILQEPTWNEEGFASRWEFIIDNVLFTV